MERRSGSGVGRGGVRKPKKAAVPNGGHASRNRGDVSEMQFMIQASNRGFGVAAAVAGAGEGQQLLAGQWILGGYVLEDEPGTGAVHCGANRLSGGGVQRAQGAWAADLVCDSGAGSGWAIECEALSIWNEAGRAASSV